MGKPDERPASNRLEDIAAWCGLDAGATEQVRAHINAMKDYFVALTSRPSVPGTASPAARLAASVSRGEKDAVAKFLQYCSTAHEPTTGTNYLLVAANHEQKIRAELEAGLPVAALARWRDTGIPSILDIDTGHDPFTKTLDLLAKDPALTEEAAEQKTNKFAGFFCHAPFEFSTVAHTGEVFVCCPAWLRQPVGNLAENTWDEVWNSEQAIALRESIYDGSYRFCSEAMCPHLSGQTGRLLRNEEVTDPYHRLLIAEQRTRLDQSPSDITVQYDRTCNLTCPSCRCDVYKTSKEEAPLIRRIHERVWTDLIRDARRITIAGDGDAFASKLYLEAIRNFDPAKWPDIRLAFITNGLLLTPEMWQSISNCWPAIESINVSCNAATPETFRINQRGGEFHKLLHNLEHLAAARHRGEFPLLGLGFYVRDNNFREMPDIVRLGQRLGVDRIIFGKLTMPSYLMGDLDAFRSMAVHLPSHPLHAEFLEVLRDPILRAPIVLLTNLLPLVPDFTPHVDGTVEKRLQLSLTELYAHLQFRQEQRPHVRQLLEEFADAVAALFLLPGTGPLRPAEVLLDLLDGPGALPHAEQWAEFESYIRGTRPNGSTKSYATRAATLEADTRARLRDLLLPDQETRLATLPVDSLLAVIELREQLILAARSPTPSAQALAGVLE